MSNPSQTRKQNVVSEFQPETNIFCQYKGYFVDVPISELLAIPQLFRRVQDWHTLMGPSRPGIPDNRVPSVCGIQVYDDHTVRFSLDANSPTAKADPTDKNPAVFDRELPDETIRHLIGVILLHR